MKKYILKKERLVESDPNIVEVLVLCHSMAVLEIDEKIYERLPERFHEYFKEVKK